MSSKTKEKIYNLFTSIETLGLAALADADPKSFYVWYETPSGHDVYRCKVKGENRVFFRLFFLERVIGVETTLYYILEAYKKKSLGDAERIAHRVKSRANSLTEGW